MKYTIKHEVNRTDGSSYVDVPTIEDIKRNKALGDQIGVSEVTNTLWFDENIDIDDKDVRDFIKDNFKNPTSVMGFIRRVK